MIVQPGKEFSTYFTDFILEVANFSFVSLDLAFQLAIMVLQAVDKMTHLTVDRAGLFIGRKVLLKFHVQHFVIVADLNPYFLLTSVIHSV